MGRYALDMEKYADLARTASAEGCVLLKNDNSTLPLKKGDKVAVFGRMAFHYYKSGLGSGGLVNTRYVVGILDALRACKDIALDEELIGIYEKWIKDHPYDEGEGWGLVPWSQEEMPVTEEMLQTASAEKWEPHSCRDLILQVPQEPSNILRQTIRKRNDMRQIRLFPCGHCGKFI